MGQQRAAGYVRVSQVAGRAGDSFISPTVQRETIERLAKAHRLKLTETVEELDVSGSRQIEERELGRLVSLVEEGKLGCLVLWRLSRFSRNLVDTVNVAERIRAAGGRILAEDFDSAGPMGRAMLGLLAGLAEEELDARRRGWRVAQQNAIRRGIHLARVPFGYTRDEDEGVLVPDPEKSELVRAAFRARAQGKSYQVVADILGSSINGAKGVIENVAYLGHVQHGDALNESAHPAIVDRRLWELAQRPGVAVPRDGSLASIGILAGIVKCAACGGACTVSGSGAPDHTASYSCRGRLKGNPCKARASMAVHKLDAFVLPLLEERGGTRQVEVERVLENFYRTAEAMALARAELDAFVSGVSVAKVGAEAYARGVTHRREAFREASEAHRTALAAHERMTRPGGLAGQRALARSLLEKVVLRRATRGRHEPVEERVEVVWR